MRESAAVQALRRLGVFVTSAELQEMAKNVGGVHDETNEVKMSAEQFVAMLEELLAAVLEVRAHGSSRFACETQAKLESAALCLTRRKMTDLIWMLGCI